MTEFYFHGIEDKWDKEDAIIRNASTIIIFRKKNLYSNIQGSKDVNILTSILGTTNKALEL